MRALCIVLVFHARLMVNAQVGGYVPPSYGGYAPPPGYTYVPPAAPGNALPGITRTPNPLPGRISHTFSWAEDAAGFSDTLGDGAASLVKKVPSGSNMLWRAGAVMGGAAAVAGVLNWFYQQAKDAANPGPLDEWGGPAGTAYSAEVVSTSTSTFESASTGYRNTAKHAVHYTYTLGNTNYNKYATDYTTWYTSSPAPDFDRGHADAFSKWLATAKSNSDRSGEWLYENYSGSTSTSVTDRRVYNYGKPPTDADRASALRGSPNLSRDFLDRVLPKYLDNAPKKTDGLPNGFSWEGGATPNANQKADSPFADPDLDSDTDGWPDAIEAGLGHTPISDYNDPYTPPPPEYNPNYDNDDDGYSDGLEKIRVLILTAPTSGRLKSQTARSCLYSRMNPVMMSNSTPIKILITTARLMTKIRMMMVTAYPILTTLNRKTR